MTANELPFGKDPFSDSGPGPNNAPLSPYELQRAAFEAMVEGGEAMMQALQLSQAGNLQGAATAYEKQLSAQRRELSLNEQLKLSGAPHTKLEQTATLLLNGLLMYADALDSLTDSSGAAERRAEALDYATRYLGESGVFEVNRSTAGSHSMRGNFSEALVALYAFRDFYQNSAQPLRVARVSMDIADIYQWLGDYDRASTLIDKAAGAVEDYDLKGAFDVQQDMLDAVRIRVEIPFYRGLIARFEGRYDDAIRYLDRAVEGYQFDQGGLFGVEFQRAMVLPKLGRHADALSLLQRLEGPMRADGRLRPKLAAFLRAEAEGLLGQGRGEEALAKIAEAIAESDRYFDPEVRWSVFWLQARIFRRLGRNGDSLSAYTRAVETLAFQRRAPLGYRLDNAYVASRLELFSEAIELSGAMDRPLECARFIDEIKARSLTAILGVRERTSQSDSALSREFADLTQRLDGLEFQSSKSPSSQAKTEHSELLTKRSLLLERLRISDPRWRALTNPEPIDIEAIAARLAANNQAALTLFVVNDEITCVLLGPSGHLVRRKVTDPTVDANLKKYFTNLVRSKPDFRLMDLSGALGVTASDLIPREIWEHACEADSIIIVPHGPLHLLPWASLEFKDQRLFQYCPVGVLPNLACLARLGSDPSEFPAVTLAGAPEYKNHPALGPLPGVAEELKALADLYGKFGMLRGDPLLGADATKAGFFSLLRSSPEKGGLLHVGCHASTEIDEPMNSGLYLTDGKVDAAEITAAGVPFEEVVLSACSTGWRPSQVADIQLVADDCLGLPGAFLESGAKSLLVSIPPADDEASAAFMLAYHRSRSKGHPPLKSYQAAQLAMLGAGEYSLSSWAGFTLYGCR